MAEQARISTAPDAADHELILAFGRLQDAASRLEHLLRPGDRRTRLVRLTPLGPASHRERFMEDLRILSRTAGDALPRLR